MRSGRPCKRATCTHKRYTHTYAFTCIKTRNAATRPITKESGRVDQTHRHVHSTHHPTYPTLPTHLHGDQEGGNKTDDEEGGRIDEAADHLLPQGLDDEGHEGIHLS